MQVNDFKNIQEAIKYEVLQDENEYLKLLKVIGGNKKYDLYGGCSTVISSVFLFDKQFRRNKLQLDQVVIT